MCILDLNDLRSRAVILCGLLDLMHTDFSFKPVLHDWCIKGRDMCYPVCRMVHIEEPCAHVVVAGFLSRYVSGPLPYVRRHITVNKMC